MISNFQNPTGILTLNAFDDCLRKINLTTITDSQPSPSGNFAVKEINSSWWGKGEECPEKLTPLLPLIITCAGLHTAV